MSPTAPDDLVAPVIDAHLHVWDPERLSYDWLRDEPALHRRFGPEDLDLGGVDVTGIVFVQADCRADQAVAEVDWVRGLANGGAPVIGPPILGIVAQAPLELGAGCGEQLASYAADPLVVGVRRLLQDEPAGFALAPGFVEGVRLLGGLGLSFDLCVRWHQLDEVVGLVEQCPEVRFVLDHLGKPPVRAGAFSAWAERLTRVAELPNVSCKISGLATEADPEQLTAAVLRPYLDHALAAFGADRCLFGSDWPVATTAVTYRAWHDLVVDACTGLPAADRERVLGGTARSVYGLPSGSLSDARPGGEGG
jgi:L-fuconolactonase